MQVVAGYNIIEKIRETYHYTEYRCRDVDDRETVICKVIKGEQPDALSLAQFKQENNKVKNAGIKGVLGLKELRNEGENLVLIQENFTGISLDVFLRETHPTLEILLEIALNVAETVGAMHAKNLVYNDLKPADILVKPEVYGIKLADFGIQTRLSSENLRVYDPQVIESTLDFMSPEQTGRMNRAVDYRTDLYSLGIVYYEMFTGRRPFASEDPLEVIHGHLARKPRPLVELNTEVPAPLSDVILKLLEKTAENRYQSCVGLSFDLETCLLKLRRQESFDDFKPATRDISIKFQLPGRLLGREQELQRFTKLYGKVTEGAREIAFVSGYSGVGKTAFMLEAQQALVRTLGYFALGKYQESRKGAPYSGLIQAFKNLIARILSESGDRVTYWRERLGSALGDSTEVLAEFIPDISLLVPAVNRAEPGGGEKTENRLNMVFQNFLRVFAREGHPLVLFLDDLHWADQASLNLLRLLLSDRHMGYFFIVGSYREDLSGPGSPLFELLLELEEKNTSPHKFRLGPLDYESVQEIVAESLKVSPSRVVGLSDTIYRKTGGNPFFVRQFMIMLYEEEAIKVGEDNNWKWDIVQIQKYPVTDNVVQLMSTRMKKLPGSAMELLQTASCMGAEFDFQLLAKVHGLKEEDAYADFLILLEEGYVLTDGEKCFFSHDRIRETVRLLMRHDTKIILHYKIGKHMLEHFSPRALREQIFEIMYHCNAARQRILDPEERLLVARLNLAAGRKARFSSAFAAAVSYFDTGLKLLPLECWDKYYRLTFDLNFEKAQCDLFMGSYDEAGRQYERILGKSTVAMDRARVYSMRILLYSRIRNMEQAMEEGRSGLELLGVKLPRFMIWPRIALSFLRLQFRLKGRPEQFLEARRTQDLREKNIYEIFGNIAMPLFLSRPDLLSWLILELTDRSLRKGVDVKTPFVYMGYALLTISLLKDYEKGYNLGLLALKAEEMHPDVNTGARISHSFGSLISLWKRPMEESLIALRRARRFSEQSGDVSYALYSAQSYIQFLVVLGRPLLDVYEECRDSMQLLERTQDLMAQDLLAYRIQMILNLAGHTRSADSFDSSDFSEKEYYERLELQGGSFTKFSSYHIKSMSLYLRGLNSEALRYANKAWKYKKSTMGVALYYEHILFYFLILAREVEYMPQPPFFSSAIRKMKRCYRMVSRWANTQPWNFEPARRLMEAELERCRGRTITALAIYGDAILEAEKREHWYMIAVASQRAGECYYHSQLQESAELMLEKSMRAYEKWGADSCVRDLADKYEFLSRRNERRTEIRRGGDMDLATFTRSTQAISSEINLEKLIKTMMKILIENAGAEKGLLLLRSGSHYKVEAVSRADGQELRILTSESWQDNSDISGAIVQYVIRTNKPVLLHDALHDERFNHETYIQKNRTHSVVCSPIIHQGQLSGLVYLENNLSVGAFTPERLESISMLSAQAAISIENARLYQELEDKVRERTQELKLTLEKVEKLRKQQDGDYFLTNQILEPLLKNMNTSRNISTRFYICQKKKFRYKRWHGELGGDFSLSGNLTFKGEAWTLFLNGDAMGKSMQGAGGAIVLGTVMNSILSRSTGDAVQEQNPEVWLENVYRELNDTFLTFDGNMLLSCVVGIISEASGAMLLINTEHPPCALYRDGQAAFIETKASLPKLGLRYEGKFKIIRANLQPGDILLAGSDGRDDINLTPGAVGPRNINSDLDLFLRLVEKSQGNLDDLVSELETQGDLTDDLSLVRVGFKE